MNIQERMDSINGVIKNIAEFIQNHEDIKADFNEYLKTIGAASKMEYLYKQLALAIF